MARANCSAPEDQLCTVAPSGTAWSPDSAGALLGGRPPLLRGALRCAQGLDRRGRGIYQSLRAPQS
eukprot:2903324-Alexandrium_andersonii.AAC.1